MSNRSKEYIFGGSMALGAAFGFLVESNTNTIAEKKAHNVSACIADMGERAVMDQIDVACISVTTDTGKLPIGTTQEQMQSYVQGQLQEADQVEFSRMLGWAFAGGTEIMWPAIIWQAVF